MLIEDTERNVFGAYINSKIVKEEEEMALAMYKLMQKNSLFGYEASNHYYFNKTILAEKVINCEYVLVGLKNR